MKKFHEMVKILRDSQTLLKLFKANDLELDCIDTRLTRQRFIKKLWNITRLHEVGYTRHFIECHDQSNHCQLLFVTTLNWENEDDRSFNYEVQRTQYFDSKTGKHI